MMLCGSETSVTIGNADASFIGQNPRRKGLLISIPSGVRLTITEQAPAVLGTGVTLGNLVSPFFL